MCITISGGILRFVFVCLFLFLVFLRFWEQIKQHFVEGGNKSLLVSFPCNLITIVILSLLFGL